MGIVLIGGTGSASSGVGQGKESVEVLLAPSVGKVSLVVYGVCAAWSDRWWSEGRSV